jgi:hypothetical protein
MPLASHKPFWSETAIFLGAGATAWLGVPTTEDMGKTIHELAEYKKDKNLRERINEVSIFHKIEMESSKFMVLTNIAMPPNLAKFNPPRFA